VPVRSNCWGAAAALTAAIALAGCANVDFDIRQAWFAKPLDVTGRRSGYTFSELTETKQAQKPITANDLVDANGACPAQADASAQAAAGLANPPTNPAGVAPGTSASGAAPAPAPDAASSLLGGGISLGMSECDVVARAGAPSNVQIGKNQDGDRTAVLTFRSGPRPGIYRFEGGALMEMDRVAEQAPPLQMAKKKAAKSPKEKKSAQN
jgi:hypothetical protein